MSSRNSLQHTVSAVEPVGAALGDEWYNSTTNLLYKRMVVGGVAQWASITSASGVTAVSAGGKTTQVQFNDAGQFAGSDSLTFDKTTSTLVATNISGALSGTLSSTAATVDGSVTSGNIVPLVKNYLWGWGTNAQAQLGLGDVTSRSIPSNVGTLTNWLSVAAGYVFSLAAKTDGTLWAWGDNSEGALGQGDTTNRSSPVQVGTLTNWLKVAGGRYHSAAIKTDGTLWIWGRGNNGQLGLGNNTSYSSPKQVGALTTWRSVSAAYYATMAIKSDNTLWGWGFGGNGQLGLNSVASPNSPVQIGLLTNWSSVATSQTMFLATKTDGTLWASGGNANGGLGDGTTINRSSPVQVGSLTNWLTVSAGVYFAAAIKTDGTFWAWGWNNAGQLGLGDTLSRSSPVQVGTLSNWRSVSLPGMGSAFTAAIKTDGTLWAWGTNNSGALGLGADGNLKSSPVQIGSSTSWSSLSVDKNRILAIERTAAGTIGTVANPFTNVYTNRLTALSGVSEKISKSITGQVGYTVTSTLSAALTLPATVGLKYIIHSIYITNVDTTNAATTQVTGSIAFASPVSTVSFANKIPIPARGALELLRKPQVLNPGDVINLQSLTSGTGANNLLSATITYEQVSTVDNYFGVGISASTVVGDAYAAASTGAVIDSIRVVNSSDLGDIAITLTWTDASNTIQSTLTNNFIVPANSTVELCESSKRISAGHKIRALATTASAISVFVSGRTQ